MCGIVGIVYAERERAPETALVKAMADLVAHRGPDDEGFLTAPGIALGMRRLSILDLSGGRQPVFSEDGQVGVVYNGEVYNYLELRAELEARGHVFRSRTDTEVIVHGYEQYGVDIVPRLHGMFALALWDAKGRRLLLARDRLGKKPLHYAALPDRLVLGSEIKSLLLDPALPRELDLEGLDDYLTYGYVAGPRTIFRAVRKLPPAHYLVWQDGRITIERYWDVVLTGEDRRPEAELVEELRALLSEAIRIRLVSDVPLGAFLSGGLDSSAVVAFMSRHQPHRVKTFSIGFEEDEFNELEYARTVARHFETDHHEFVVRPNVLEDLPQLVWQLDEPFADESAIPTYYVARLARAHVTVALSGDGGDESFGGYTRYVSLDRDPLVRCVPGWARRALPFDRCIPVGVKGHGRLRRARLPAADRYAEGMAAFPEPYRRRLYTPDLAARLRGRDSLTAYTAYFDGAPAMDVVSAAQNADIHRYLPDDILVKVDRMSMLASLETRSPLLDHRIVEFMARLPLQWKIRNDETKYLFKRAMTSLLPEDIIRRRKMGFGVPFSHWFRGGLKPFLDDVLLSGRCAQRGLFNTEFVRTLVRQHQRGLANHQRRLWNLICFELWARMYLDGDEWQRRPLPSAAPLVRED